MTLVNNERHISIFEVPVVSMLHTELQNKTAIAINMLMLYAMTMLLSEYLLCLPISSISH